MKYAKFTNDEGTVVVDLDMVLAVFTETLYVHESTGSSPKKMTVLQLTEGICVDVNESPDEVYELLKKNENTWFRDLGEPVQE